MIGYRITLTELKQKIEGEKPGWLQRASDRTDRFRQNGKYEESSSIWSEIKVIYMRLQGEGKCAFCERKLEAETFGRVEQDVEHFRPKKKVKPWNIPRALSQLGIQAAQVPPNNKGYYLLAYHPFNYAASCKPCNSTLKGNYFPVRKDYDMTGDDPRPLLLIEEPYLIYPIGNFDKAPDRFTPLYSIPLPPTSHPPISYTDKARSPG